jgi:hypothetical protein
LTVITDSGSVQAPVAERPVALPPEEGARYVNPTVLACALRLSYLPEAMLQIAGFLASFAVIAVLFAMMFKWLPDTPIERNLRSPGVRAPLDTGMQCTCSISSAASAANLSPVANLRHSITFRNFRV